MCTEERAEIAWQFVCTHSVRGGERVSDKLLLADLPVYFSKLIANAMRIPDALRKSAMWKCHAG